MIKIKIPIVLTISPFKPLRKYIRNPLIASKEDKKTTKINI